MSIVKKMLVLVCSAFLASAMFCGSASATPNKVVVKGINDVVYLTIRNNTRYYLESTFGVEVPPYAVTVERFDHMYSWNSFRARDSRGVIDSCTIDINFHLNPPIISLMPQQHRNAFSCVSMGDYTNEVVFYSLR